MASYLTLPSGKPSPYSQPHQGVGGEKPPVNPWAGSGFDPTKPFTSKQSGSAANARAGLNYAAQQGWGKQLSDQDFQEIAKDTGYTQGEYSSDQYNQALGGLEKRFGGPANGGGQNQPPPVTGVPQNYRAPVNPYAGAQQQMMSKILASPETMDQQFQDQLGEKQKESGNRMLQQFQGQNQQQSVGRGFGGGGGQEQQMQQRGQNEMVNNLLAGRRDIATQAVGQNRQDQYNALNQSMQMQGQDFQQDLQGRGQNLNEFLGMHGADMDVNNFNQQNDQFNKGYGLDFLRYLQQGSQFDRSLDQNGKQFNDQQGFNWAQLNQQQQQNFLNMLMNGMG